MRCLTRTVSCLLALFLLLPDLALASHFRGGDIWTTVDANGVVHLFARTRWRKGSQPFPFSSLGPHDSGLFQIFRVDADGTATLVVTLSPSLFIDKDTGMRLTTNDAFNADTTISSDMTDAAFDERFQRIILPIGAFNPGPRHVEPLNLAQGLYEIRWSACARVAGLLNNFNSQGICETGVSYYGLRTRVVWNGTANGGPSFDAAVIAGVVRGADYAQNLNAVDPDGQSLAYELAVTIRDTPHFGPQSHIAGLSLDQFGNVRIPPANTTFLGNNGSNPAADYQEKFVITDPSGALSERDFLLDAVSDRGLPALSPIGNRTIQVGTTLTFDVLASCPATGLTCSNIAIRTTALPPEATLSAGAGNPLTRTFSWTPSQAQAGTYTVNFEAVATFASPPQTARSEFVTFNVVGTNQPPRLQEVGNLRVGIDPLGVAAFVSQSSTFDVFAIDPNAGDVLTYSLPILISPAGNSVPLAALGASISPMTVMGRPVGRIVINPDALDVGVWQLRVRVDDEHGAADEQNVFVSVGTFTNRSPIFTTAPPAEVFATEGGGIQFNVTAADPDGGQVVTLSGSGLPPGAIFATGTGNPITRPFSWTPGAGTAGDYTVLFEARDNGGAPITERVSLVIHVLRACSNPLAEPRIIRLEPGRGTEDGGTTVHVVGGPWCSPITSVAFGGQNGTGITPIDYTRFSVVTPAGNVGDIVDVVVTADGHSVTLTGGFTYVDSTPPTLTCGADVTLAAGLSGTALMPDLLTGITVSDNATPTAQLLLTQIPPPGTVLGVGAHTVTITATDQEENSSSCSVTVTVEDRLAPEVFCPSPVTLAANAAGQAPIPDFLAGLSASDNVTLASALVKSQNPMAGALVGIGTHSVTIEVTDEAGNTGSCTATVIVADQMPPTLSCPTSLTVAAGANGLAAVPDLFAGLTVSDDITPVASLIKTQDPLAGSFLGVGLHAISLTVADEASNTSSCSVTLVVVDETDPTLLCPLPQSAQPDVNGQAAVQDFLAGLTASDNVTEAGALVKTQSPAAGTILGIGTHTIVVTVTDAAGNSSSCETTFTILDTIAPTVACPLPTTLAASASGQAAVPDVLAGVVASDNVTATASLAITQNPAAGTLLGVGTHTITVTVTDEAGNSETCSTTLTIVDDTPPVVDTPATVTVVADANGQGAVPDFLAALSASDNVTAESALARTQSPAAGTLVGVGPHAVSITVTDQAGNDTTVATTVIVVDNTAPAVSCPVPQIISANANGQGLVPNFLLGASATDNVTPASALILAQNPAAGLILGVGTHTITIGATDAAGNTGSCTTSVTIDDTTPPVAACPLPVNLFAGATGQAAMPDILADVTASDNVTPASGPTITQTPAAGTLLGVGTHTVTVTVTDAAGNSSECSTMVTVVDNTPPAIACPLPVTLSAGANGLAAIPDLLAGVTASDNVTAAGALTMTQSPVAGTLVGPGTHIVTVTVTDEAGNSSSCSTTVTIADTTAPAITGPGNITANATTAAGAVVIFVASATDNVDGTLAVSCNPPPGSTFPIGSTPVVCITQDAAANPATHSFTVTVLGASDQITDLISDIAAIGGNVAGSLRAKLDHAFDALARGNTNAACGSLKATGHQLKAQSGKSVPADIASMLIADIDRINQTVGCK